MASKTGFGGDAGGWYQPNNANDNDNGTYAYNTAGPYGVFPFLRLWGYNFNIPTTAKIDALWIIWSGTVAYPGAQIMENHFGFSKDATNISSTNLATSSRYWPSSLYDVTYGGPVGNIGLGSITPAEVNRWEFGFFFKVNVADGSSSMFNETRLHRAKIKVDYTDVFGVKRYTGSVWEDRAMKRWNGTNWVTIPNNSVKRWNGSSWV